MRVKDIIILTEYKHEVRRVEKMLLNKAIRRTCAEEKCGNELKN